MTTYEETVRIREVLNDVHDERDRQLAQWGEQNHPDHMPADYPVGDTPNYERTAQHWKSVNAARVAWMNERGVPTDRNAAWDGILLEEVYEALAETDPAKMRAELVQVAATATAWVESIDRRCGRKVNISERPTCPKCDKPYVRHGITSELTCFVHGNPNGSEPERRIWNSWQTATLKPGDKVRVRASNHDMFGEEGVVIEPNNGLFQWNVKIPTSPTNRKLFGLNEADLELIPE